MIENYKSLLEQADLIYEKHEAGRKEPFNVFTVLRKASDEVNLHSRFLHALLDHQSPDTGRQNLKDFLQKIGVEKFKIDGATVRREYKNIDILIINNDTKQHPVVIENKIYAEDRPAQLQTYYDTLEKEKYSDIHLLYLTLDGRDPSKCSVGNRPYQTISYRDDLLPWLKCCQMYACEEPELRESIAQYIHLIRKLTGTDFEEAYMNKLKDLVSKNNNLILAHDLNEALIRAKISLLQELWCDIDSALKNLKQVIPDFPNKDVNASNISEKTIKKYIKKKEGSLLLYYGDSTEVHLGVQLGRSNSCYNIYFGVFCDETVMLNRYKKLKKALHDALSGRYTNELPWWRYADEDLCFDPFNRKTLKLLSDESKRKKFADGIADGLKEIWEQMEEADLI